MRDAICCTIPRSRFLGEQTMRATLNIDNDLLIAVDELASRNSKSAGAIVSGLLRQGGLNRPRMQENAPAAAFGFRPLPERGGVVTKKLIDRLSENTID